MSVALRYYFDFISPYAYLGWTQIHALAARHEVDVEPVPVLFAAMLNTHGHKGPAEIPPKRTYVFKNVVRLAHGFGVPLQPPPSHPFNPLLPLRICTAPLSAADQRTLVSALFDAAWGHGEGVDAPQRVRAALEGTGLDADALLTWGADPAAKAKLRASTEAAIEAGVFGVPSVEVDGEVFWGVDAFPHVEARLRGEDPVTEALLQRWADLPASAAR